MNFLETDIINKPSNEIKNMINCIDFIKTKESDILNMVFKLKEDKRKNVQNFGHRLMNNYEKHKKEVSRVSKLYDFDKSFQCKYVAGVDEVGRGPLAGPIVAAAVILDLNCPMEDILLGINDSKALNENKRKELSEIIKSKALSYSINLCDNEEIDEKGIGFCNNEVFKKACNDLSIKPDLVLSDGYKIKDFQNNNVAVIKGDTKSASIACASIIAKVYRDELMKKYHDIYPYYDFINNVGYGTQKHIQGIRDKGLCKIHRKSFLTNIIKSEMRLL